MVEWLTNPTEWECAPDEIELMDIIGNNVFVYRFRIEASRPWTVGISGRVVFSDFRPADSATAEEHAARMLLRFPDDATGHRH
jgi:RNase P/RNase MRP subunit p29